MKKILAVILCLVLMAGVCCADTSATYIDSTYSASMSDQSISLLMYNELTRAVCAMSMMMDVSSNGGLPESVFYSTNSFYIGYSGTIITLCLDSDEGIFAILYDMNAKQLAYINYGTYSGLGEFVMGETQTAYYTVSASDLESAVEALGL